MKKFSRRRGMITTQLSPYEVELLESLIMQLIELISDGEPEGFPTSPEPVDTFDALVQDLQVDPDEPEVSEEPTAPSEPAVEQR